MDLDGHPLLLAVGVLDGLATPKPLHFRHALEPDLAGVAVGMRRRDEVVRVPAAGESHVDTTVGEVVQHGPRLDDTRRMMQRQHDTARTQPDLGCLCGKIRQQRAWVREKAAELEEMALRHPDGLEAVCVRETRDVADVVVRPGRWHGALAREEDEAEVHLARAPCAAPEFAKDVFHENLLAELHRLRSRGAMLVRCHGRQGRGWGARPACFDARTRRTRAPVVHHLLPMPWAQLKLFLQAPRELLDGVVVEQQLGRDLPSELVGEHVAEPGAGDGVHPILPELAVVLEHEVIAKPEHRPQLQLDVVSDATTIHGGPLHLCCE
jgi:hypothetical protein